jgi:hypothetical protein
MKEGKMKELNVEDIKATFFSWREEGKIQVTCC